VLTAPQTNSVSALDIIDNVTTVCPNQSNNIQFILDSIFSVVSCSAVKSAAVSSQWSVWQAYQ